MGALEKATISVRDPDPQKDTQIKQIKALFNPEKYSLEKSATWEEKGRQKTLEFVGISRKSFSIELFFDTYEQGTDVRTHTNEIVQLMDPTIDYKGKKVPPVCVFSWGGFNFRGIVEKVTQNFTLFFSDGKPARAVLTVGFKQFNYPSEQARGNPPGDPTKMRTAKEGETLNLIAAQEYGDPGLWRVIADANRDTMRNPRDLRAGTPIVIPALK
jgi:nucleoid-associated protein YgaU